MLLLTEELTNRLEQATRVEVHYKPPHTIKYAVVEYNHRRGKPLKVVSYYIYGEELKSGKPLICFEWVQSTNFNIIKDNISTKEEAELKLNELRRK